jgi:hypothetical protein
MMQQACTNSRPRACIDGDMETFDAVRQVLLFIVLPLWLAAGFADYLCHRATRIEHANGARESVLHWLMLGEVGVAVLAAVFLKVNALVLAFMILCLVAHEITTHLDLQLAIRTRKVTALEQQVHSFLEVMPLGALLLVLILHWSQAQALFGFGGERPDYALVLKPWPGWGVIGPPAVAAALLVILPYAEEFIRGLRQEARVRGENRAVHELTGTPLV